MYDIIGDIHGFAEPLRQLLTKLGYSEIGGVWQHPTRKALFLGDYIDRGPQQVEVVRIVRAMEQAGHALAILGNHEFNAVAWATPNPNKPGEYLRPHNAKNLQQHREFLQQVGENSPQHQEIICWFKTLPVFLELPGFRAVHACWHCKYLDELAPRLDEKNRLKDDAWLPASRKGHPVYAAVETLLKGLEIPLPDGEQFHDKDGYARTDIRTRWWLQHTHTYRDLAMVPADVIERIPHQPVPSGILPGYDNQKPLFVGHYWLTGDPAPLADQIACLDYSVVSARQGKLVAYRWDGKPLSKENYIWVARTEKNSP
ncbi:MAG: metallophosphoesterase [Alcanivoracaceae bacterium]|nr:metallophosphoesterase [Alcanivoracaceae bacterium]|tara:strand:- start:1512 stop:2453 length:942 start_codon:yes stop_codon:yes gene_type:complete